jgi:hypothetical protein
MVHTTLIPVRRTVIMPVDERETDGKWTVCRAHLDDGGILLATFYELVVGELGVVVSVHVGEDLVYSLWSWSIDAQTGGRRAYLLWCVLVPRELHHLPRHLVYRADDLEHLVIRDESIAVDIVQLERPCAKRSASPWHHRPQRDGRTLELLVEPATAGDAERADELAEVDGPVLVLVEDIEDVVRELARVAEREELAVDAPELGLVELAARAVLQKALVPRYGQLKAHACGTSSGC